MKPHQSYREWVADLRGLARECNFSCSAQNCLHNFVDDMIRDQIIIRTPHDAVRTAAFQKPHPTLADVLQIAELYETTTKTVATIKEQTIENSMPVNSVSTIIKKPGVFSNNNNKVKFKSCSGCGNSHARENCKFRNAVCNRCSKIGHIAPVCMSKQNKNNKRNSGDENKKKDYRRKSHNIGTVETINSLTGIVKTESNKNYIDLEICNKIVSFQMDSGATVSLINKRTFKTLNCPKLRNCTKTLFGFGKTEIPVLGELCVYIKCGGKEREVVIVVVDVENCNNLFGFDLFKEFGFEIQQICNITESESHRISELCKKYGDIFEPALGTIKNFKKEVDRLTNAGIWKPVKFSQWASPIVLAPKADGSIRICGDFKQAVNAQIDIEQYPLPIRESLFHKINCGQHFTKIDLKDAYLQMELDDEAKTIMVVNTPLGLFQYQRLPFGIASAPAIFQRYLEQLLQGVEGCGNYLDDIIISAPTFQQHISRLEQVLRILQQNGILPDESGLKAVKNLQPPKDLKQAEAFMGKVNYYHNFIPNFSQLSAPINMLRRKNVKFTWGTAQQQAFTALKTHILNAAQLAHYQEDLPLVLATDASSYGIGVVLSHTYVDGTERPIAFASKTLDIHQRRYSQIEKEGLAIVFGVKRFHQYLYGRRFTLVTDHKPLVSIFNPIHQLPSMTSHRLQRWAIILMAYQYDVRYRKTTEHGNADALSRLPVGEDKTFDHEESCFNINELNTPIDAEIIRQHAKNDPILRRVYFLVTNGWPEKLMPQDTEYNRVVIPASLKQKILKLLHDGHWGVSRMKQLARQHVWWTNIDKDIAQLTENCDVCKIANPVHAREYVSWPEADRPWERVHIDFAGPFCNSMWLICVDAFSQFPFVVQLSTTTTVDTISALSSIFSLEGIPETIVSDNGPQFTAEAFKHFCSKLGIKHITTAPFHPASNGLAERFVRSFKTAVQKNIDDGLSLKFAVSKYLATYRAMPNAEGKSPAELLHGRPVRTLLSQLFESPRKHLEASKRKMKFSLKQPVFARNYARGEKWIKGVIVKQLGKMVYRVNTSFGYIKRHVNQLKTRSSSDLSSQPIFEFAPNFINATPPSSSQSTLMPSEERSTEVVQLRKSGRIRKDVIRFESDDFRKT
ncbi:uncharacterized protein K02A2.6-like [Teleopsis dalmanni]|uniref:uncharacterized protein K02A2.6-like n=1 Tax=Teleopsis dalmanni TaxID=139649 RepID=UPI0018CE5103|nr:uncharacterized protein K02A2.6-like [Teleopsis dalmanni]